MLLRTQPGPPSRLPKFKFSFTIWLIAYDALVFDNQATANAQLNLPPGRVMSIAGESERLILAAAIVSESNPTLI
jgi:hypothetical protein